MINVLAWVIMCGIIWPEVVGEFLAEVHASYLYYIGPKKQIFFEKQAIKAAKKKAKADKKAAKLASADLYPGVGENPDE